MVPVIPASRANNRITSMIVILYNNFLTDFISCLQMVKDSVNTTCVLSFCCKSGSNWKTQPCYWLATNKNTEGKKHNRNIQEDRLKTKGKEAENIDQVGLQEAPHL
jgi:hypothetical protein